ncbi:MAG: hypothetical protein KC544_00170 [Gemmatimonadetes bacterium]|nr:hypothetical protein [Gemmatimonadota bacterium]MCB9517519.1 hypothetical protein [Gemmatimonadales bacterium]
MTVGRARLFLAGVGLLLALLAIGLDDRRLTWVAIGVLAAALVLRVWARGEKRDARSEE